jgi:UDP-3-O-acyl-N-acetylglucosamine deacetylase
MERSGHTANVNFLKKLLHNRDHYEIVTAVDHFAEPVLNYS